MADYRVMFDKESGEWRTMRDGASRASARSGTQAQAADKAKRLADSSGGGEVSIHRKDDNRIRAKHTIGKPDPFPPSG